MEVSDGTRRSQAGALEEGPAAQEAGARVAQGRGEGSDAAIVGGKVEVLGVDHVNVTAPEDLEEETVSWYESCLGLERITKPEGTRERGGWFKAGEQQIHVSIDQHNPHQAAHFAVVVSDFDEIVNRLRDANCHIEQARPIPGRKRCFTRDPAGNRIELMAYQEGS